MKQLILAVILAFTSSFAVSAPVCFSPGCTDEEIYAYCLDDPDWSGCPTMPTYPKEICFGTDCTPVSYAVAFEDFIVAQTTMSNGYAIVGWAGPCAGGVAGCKALANQAFNDLQVNAIRTRRAQQ